MISTNQSSASVVPLKPLSEFICHNRECADFGKKDGHNIAIYTRYGQKKTRLLVCKTCSKTFSEHHHTKLAGCRLPFELVGKMLAALIGGASIRGVSRDFGCSKNTPKRYLRLMLAEPDTFWPHVQKADATITREKYDEFRT